MAEDRALGEDGAEDEVEVSVEAMEEVGGHFHHRINNLIHLSRTR